jgi:putative oxidoreductase
MSGERHEPSLILPVMGPFYRSVAEPLAHLGLRVLVGGLLVIEGWPKILAPFAMSGFTESIGMYPGWLWSAVLAVMQFGGILILAGFLTRPVALANAVMLAVTLWFHATHPYGAAILSPDGMAALTANADLFTEDGLRNLAADGGALFLHQVQFKAEGLSALWTVAALFLAAWGAGPLSVDRTILKREF